MRQVSQCVFLVCLIAASSYARNVVFVDNARAGGRGTYDQPFGTLAEAQAASKDGDAIYLAEGNAPYESGITLKRGQMLIGAAFGLDAAAVEFKTQFDRSVPAVQGPGPTIHGSVWLNGGNVVAGCTIVVESAAAIGSGAVDAPIALRKVFIKLSQLASGIALQAPGAVSIIEGGIDGATSSSGLTIAGGSGDIVVERFPISGAFGTAIAIGGRDRGKIVFRNRSTVKVTSTRDAVILDKSAAPIALTDPVQLVSRGGRGLFARNVSVTISGGNSSIESVNAAAIEMQNAKADIVLDSVSSAAAAPGKMNEGLILEKVSGKFVVAGRDAAPGSGGAIRGAQSYGIRIVQSSGIRLSHLSVSDSGSADAICIDATDRETNVRCRAAIYLRHVSASAFEDIAVTGGAGVGLNANNIADVTFSDLQISGAGSTAQEPGLLLQETIGKIAFTHCRIEDGAGGDAVFEQRFNSTHLVFARCTFGSPKRTPASPWLMRARSAGNANLEMDVVNSELHDNAGDAIRIEVADAGRMALTLDDSTVSGIGGRAVAVTARDRAHVRFGMHRSQIYAAGTADRVAVSVAAGINAGDAAIACADINGNHILTGSSEPSIRIVAGSLASSLYVASMPPDANAGARAVIESSAPMRSACP